MEKLSAGSSALIPGGQNILIDLSSWYKDSLAPKIAEIRKAMDHCRLLCFHYFAPKGETRRCIEPYYLIFQWASWYVWGYCQDRKDYRLFKLKSYRRPTRISGCFLSATKSLSRSKRISIPDNGWNVSLKPRAYSRPWDTISASSSMPKRAFRWG